MIKGPQHAKELLWFKESAAGARPGSGAWAVGSLQDIFGILCGVAGVKKVPNFVGVHHSTQPVGLQEMPQLAQAGLLQSLYMLCVQMSGQLAGKLFLIHAEFLSTFFRVQLCGSYQNTSCQVIWRQPNISLAC